jgi:microcystin-dependent protein
VSEPYVGEIRIFAGNFAPEGWSFCNGSLLAIAENPTLFDLIGTTYGGDGVNTFALPNLSGRIPFAAGGTNSLIIGELAGTESVTLTTGQVPTHNHTAQASGAAAASVSPAGNVSAAWGDSPYTSDPPNATMDPNVISSSGGGQPHENRPPFLATSFIISLFGIFPSQN